MTRASLPVPESMIYETFLRARKVLPAFFLLTGFSVHADGMDKAKPPATEIYEIQASGSNATTAIGGTINSKREVSLTAQLPGRIKYIAGQEGDAVKNGSLLISLDDAELQANLQAARAQQASANASIRNAGAQLNREIQSPGISSNAPGGMALPSMMDRMFTNPMQDMMGMRQQGAERNADYIARQSGLEKAQAAYYQALSNVKVIESKIRDSRSIAPFNGVIAKNFVEAGDTVQPGQPLMTFSDLSGYQLDVNVPMRLRATLTPGQQLPVRIDSIQEPVTATVSRIHPVADKIRHTVHVEFSLPAHPKVSAGMYAKVMIADSQQSNYAVVSIPRSAIVMRGGLPLVFVVNPENHVAVRMVRPGETDNDGKVIILSGLTNGEKIVAAPGTRMQSGDSIH